MKHCLTLTHACTWMHDQTNTRPAVCRDKHTSSRLRFCRSLHKHPAALPDTSGFRGAPPGLAWNFLFGSLKEAVECDVITDLGTVGSVTMAPSGVTTSLSVPSRLSRLVERSSVWPFLLFGFYQCSSERDQRNTYNRASHVSNIIIIIILGSLCYNLEIKNQILRRLQFRRIFQLKMIK